MIPKSKLHCIFIFVLIIAVSKTARGQTMQDVKNLHDFLFNDYRKNIVPISNHSTNIDIGISFYLLSINEFKEIEETLVMTGAMGTNWTDVSLSWDPANYGGKSFFSVDATDVWKPLLYLVNNAKKLEPIGSDTPFSVIIFSNGQVIFSPGGILEAKCTTDISNFPLDTQTCALQFMAWGFGTETYTFSSYSTTVNTDYFTKNSNWELVRTSAYAKLNTGYYSYEVSLTLKRKPVYYIVMIVLPTLLLSLLNPLVFVLPIESGERISLAVTILLSYAIFLTLVAASIPASSNPMCVLLVIMIIIMMISGMTVVAVIISASYYYQASSYTPGTCIKILFKINNKKVQHGSENNNKLGTSLTGQDVSSALDKIFLIVSYVLIVIIIMVFFVYTTV